MSATNRRCVLAVTCAAMVILIGCQTASKPTWDLPPEVKTLPVNGYPMAYVERGSGPTLILVHGSLNDYRYWTPQLETLSSRFRVVSLSLRQYYPERWNGEGRFSLDQHAQDVAVFIEHLNAESVYLVGWSRGGRVAVRTSLERPELVKKLALMYPQLGQLVPVTNPGGSRAGSGALTKGAEGFYRKGDLEGGLEYYFDGVNGAGAWRKLPEVQRQIRLDNAWTLVGEAADANAKPVTCADLRELKMPVLLMTGEKSPPQFGPILNTFQQCQPAATRVTIPNAAHQMSQHNPPAFNTALIKFMLE